MDPKLFLKAVSRKIHNKKKHFRGATKSYVSLFLVLMLLIVGTTAWLTKKDNIAINSPLMELKSSSGIHDDQLQTRQTELKIPEFRLEEASSIDGRNIYFPVSTVNNVNDAADALVDTTKASGSADTLVNWSTTNSNMKTQTEAMRFREGNAGDKNKRYAYVDTTINAAGGETKVWLKGYNVTLGSNEYKDEISITYNSSGKPTSQNFPNPYSCPIRIAIIEDSGKTPKVFDPAARLADDANNTYAVKYINGEGVPTTQMTQLDSFSSYYYGTDNPLFVIAPGKSVNMTVVAWLEGTHPFADSFKGQIMTVSLEIETNVNEMEQIYLHDWTIGDEHESGVTESNYIEAGKTWSGHSWLTGDVDIAMSYYDTFAQVYKTEVMTECTGTNTTAAERAAQGLNANGKDVQGHTVYRAPIPKYVNTKISFYRLSKPSDDVYPGTVYNSWHTYEGVNGHMTSRAQSWRVLGNLAENRKMKNSSTCYSHYYAIRGNGNSYVAHDDSDRYEKWLAPGVGYWGTSSAPVKVT